jgi:hypothetical protein
MKRPPPLSPDLEALLAPHRAVLRVPPSVEARAIMRATAVAESPDRDAGRLPGRPLWVFAAAAGAVLVVGAGAYAARTWLEGPAYRAPLEPVISASVDRPEPRPQIALRAPRPIAALAPRAAEPSRPRRLVSKANNAVSARPTNAELALLGAGREDVMRGDFVGALAVITEHARRFRNGALVEEREALRVKSLAGLGRHEEARRAAAAFNARFPHSVFLQSFERLKESDR